MIRELIKEDKDSFISMVSSFYKSEAVLHDIPKESIINTFNEIVSHSPYAKAYIIENNGQTAGYGLLSSSYSSEAGGMVIWIEELFIRDEFRGYGLGREFLHFIKSEFSSKAKRIRLELTKSNESALRLYLSNGYEPLEYMQMVYDF